jgi:hypothetical protein
MAVRRLAALTDLTPAPKARSGEIVTWEGREWRRSRPFRCCPLGTVQDRCEWHASGMAGENNDASHPAVTAPARPERGAHPWRPPLRWRASEGGAPLA